MNLQTAFLILRMELTLSDEGRGVDDPQPEDSAILAEALRLAGHLIEPVYLYHADLITLDRYRELAGGPR